MKLGEVINLNGRIGKLWAINGNDQTGLVRFEDDNERVTISKWVFLNSLQLVKKQIG